MEKDIYKGIWVFAEQCAGKLNDVTFELLAKAQQLKEHCGETVTAVLLGDKVRDLASLLIARGADQIIIAEHDNLSVYSARPYQRTLTQLAEKYKPSIILYGATSQGRDLAPRVMVSLRTGLTADAIDLGFDEDGVFYQTTPGYGGKILAHIVILERRPQMATVRPKIFAPLEEDSSRRGVVICENISVEADDCYELLSTQPKLCSGMPIDKAKMIVSGGRGVKTSAEIKLLKELAGLLGAQVAGSRPLIDSGMLGHECQIGQSGSTVKPELIINVAISGSVQYKVGMQDAKRIMSINNNHSAPIFDISNYAAVADFKALLPAVIDELRKNREK